ncbi:hypothetical protein MRY82_04615 [bacterium]|nr:hypothetical protein [bacterium]
MCGLLMVLLTACNNEKTPKERVKKVTVPVIKYVVVKDKPCWGDDCLEDDGKDNDAMPMHKKHADNGEAPETVCPKLEYAKNFEEFGQDKDQLNCNLLFDDVGLCADLYWQSSQKDVVGENQILCLYFWNLDSPGQKPDYVHLDYDLTVNFSMDGDAQAMGHNDFAAKIETLQSNIYSLYSINFAMKGVWKTKFTLNYEGDVVSEFTTSLNVDDKDIDYHWEGL